MIITIFFLFFKQRKKLLVRKEKVKIDIEESDIITDMFSRSSSFLFQ